MCQKLTIRRPCARALADASWKCRSGYAQRSPTPIFSWFVTRGWSRRERGRGTRSVPRHRLGSKAEMHEAGLAAAERELDPGEHGSAVLDELRGAVGEPEALSRRGRRATDEFLVARQGRASPAAAPEGGE